MLSRYTSSTHLRQRLQVFLGAIMGVNWTEGKLKLVKQTVEQNSWLEPFRWKAVWPFCRTFEQPEQQILTAGGGAWICWAGAWTGAWDSIAGCIRIWGCIWALGCIRTWNWGWGWVGSTKVPLSEVDINGNDACWTVATEAARKQTLYLGFIYSTNSTANTSLIKRKANTCKNRHELTWNGIAVVSTNREHRAYPQLIWQRGHLKWDSTLFIMPHIF